MGNLNNPCNQCVISESGIPCPRIMESSNLIEKISSLWTPWQNQLNCSSISIGSSQLFQTPGELRQLIYEECMWDFLARWDSMEPLERPRSATAS